MDSILDWIDRLNQRAEHSVVEMGVPEHTSRTGAGSLTSHPLEQLKVTFDAARSKHWAA